MKKWLQIVLYVVLGLFIGSINGFLGAGAGMLFVPIYTLLSKNNSKKSHATAVFVIMPICLVSAIVYILKGVFSFTIFVPVAVGSVVGSLCGTFLLKKLSCDVLSIVFWIVMIVAGVLIIIF